MAEPESQTIDTEKVRGIIAEWDGALNSYSSTADSNTAAGNACLATLRLAGLDQGFSESFDNNFKALAESLKSVSGTLKTAVGYIEDQDDNNRRGMPGGSGRRSGGGGGGGGRSTEPAEEKTEAPTASGVDNMKLQIDEYRKMNMSDLQNVADALLKAAKDNNMTIEELLGDKNNSELIKETLLGSIKSEELKKLIEEGNIDVTRQAIVNILTGEVPEVVGIDENTALTLSKYLESIANNNNITLADLVGKEENSKLLKDSLTSFSGLRTVISGTKTEDIIETMSNINDGNYSNPDVKDLGGVVGIIRSHIAALAENSGVQNEQDVIASQGYGNAVSTLGQFSVFANNATNFNVNNMMALVKNTLSTLKQASSHQSSESQS